MSAPLVELPPPQDLPPVPPSARRTRPRIYPEWKALYEGGQIPSWEPIRPGYRLRLAREQASLTQAELAEKLGVTQQAIARAERVDANPTVALMQRWADACRATLTIQLEP